MTTITTFLTFKDQAEEAARFYVSVIPGSRITRVSHYPELGPQFPFKAGSVMTVEFTLAGREFVALNGGPDFVFSMGNSISVQVETQEELDRIWDKLLEGGKAQACGWLTDRYGLSWQVNPRILMEAVTDPDPRRSAKAMQAMMTMVKIDVAGIRRALEQD